MSFLKQKVRAWRAIYAAASLLSILLAVSIPAPGAFAQDLRLDGPRPLATPTPPVSTTPSALVRPGALRSKPIPPRVKLAIVATTLVVALITFVFALRAWRSGNLFDRQYRFPPIPKVALRLGATRSGGRMATITFSDGDAASANADSTAKDL